MSVCNKGGLGQDQGTTGGGAAGKEAQEFEKDTHSHSVTTTEVPSKGNTSGKL